MIPPPGYRMIRNGEIITDKTLVLRTRGWGPPRAPDTVGQVWHPGEWKPMAVPDVPADFSKQDEGGVV